MSGWIKVRTQLFDRPKVGSMARRLRLDRFAVLGRLVVFWGWVDAATTTGTIPDATFRTLDDIVRTPGFTAALESVGWVELTDAGIVIPEFERWFGSRIRSRERERAKKQRQRGKAPPAPKPCPPGTRRVCPPGTKADVPRGHVPRGQDAKLYSSSSSDSLEIQTIPTPKTLPAAARISFDPDAKCFTGIDDARMALWAAAYPAVDIPRQLAVMAAWLIENPTQRKSNYGRFITNWLTRQQDRGGDRRNGTHGGGPAATPRRGSENGADIRSRLEAREFD